VEETAGGGRGRVANQGERVGRETAEGVGREERVWPEGVARVAPGYTLRALVGFSRRYIPCRGHHSIPPIRTGVRGLPVYIHARIIPRGFGRTRVGQHVRVPVRSASKCVSRCA